MVTLSLQTCLGSLSDCFLSVLPRNTTAVQAALSASAGTPSRLSDLLVEPSWRDMLGNEFAKPYMATLDKFLHEEWARGAVYPPKEHIFRWATLLHGRRLC